VSPYNPEYDSMEIPIVDAGILYHDQHTGIDHILIVRNALHIPSMTHNLIPPFIMREQGIIVNEAAKIHVEDPDENDHAIIIGNGLRIPLSLSGTFSCFETRKPTAEEMNGSENVYVLTPEEFDPHSEVYPSNEAAMTGWEGEMRLPDDRERIMLQDLPEDPDFPDYTISALEQTTVDERLLNTLDESHDISVYHDVPMECDQIGFVLTSVSPSP